MKKAYKDINIVLIQSCKKGNRKAQFEVYKLYSKAMFNASFRILNNKTEAEDTIQEAFLKAFQKINSFSEDVSFGAWLKKIVVNASLDKLRKNKIEFYNIDDVNLSNIEQEVNENKTNEYEVKQIKDAIQLLPDGYRIILSLYLLEGYDHDEISKIMGITASTSRSQLARAKKKLIQELKKAEQN